jgi:hypothetical protein
MADSNASERRIRAAQRRVEALNLRLEGRRFREIGEAMGVSEQTAHRLVTTELKRLNAVRAEQAAELVRLQSERIDALLQAMWPKALAGEAVAVNQVLALLQRQARLHGIDAPVKKEIGNLNGTPFKLYGGFNPEEV